MVHRKQYNATLKKYVMIEIWIESLFNTLLWLHAIYEYFPNI